MVFLLRFSINAVMRMALRAVSFCTLLAAGTVVPSATAAASFKVGAQVVTNLESGGVTWYDSTGAELVTLVLKEPFVGLRLTAEYWPCAVLRVRASVAEIQVPFAGGFGYSVFPALGAELAVAPPLRSRVKPYIWGGVSISSWSGPSGFSNRARSGDGHSLRSGIGVDCSVVARLSVATEVQLWGSSRYTTVDPLLGVTTETVEGVAIHEVRLGVSYAPE